MKELLEQTGEALYGRAWRSQIAELLGVDRRRIAHWVSGDRPIPKGIWEELYRHAQQRNQDIDKILHLLEKVK